tara:strand:- start:328 stop:618 length:291 start_codon:yes stop_codon:yes gene_type:complete
MTKIVKKRQSSKQKKADQILADCNDKCWNLFDAIHSMATVLAQKKSDQSFDESMDLAKIVVQLAHRIVETDKEHEKALTIAKKFMLANPELCTCDD